MPINASNYEACMAKIVEKGAINAREARSVLEAVSDHADQLVGGSDKFITAAKELSENIRATARANRIDAVRNALKQSQVMDRVRAEGGISKAGQILRSVMHWVPGAKRLDSIEGLYNARFRQWVSALSNKVSQAGMRTAALSSELDLQAAREMMAQGAAQGPITGEPSSPGKVLGGLIKQSLEHMTDRLNAAGARIARASDYIMHTTHDSRAMRLAGGVGATIDQAFEQWFKDVRPWTDERIFDELVPGQDMDPFTAGETREEKIQKFARSFYEATVTGIHKSYPGLGGLASDAGGFVPAAYEGTRNIARSLSQQRVWRFKDADSWVAYNQKYGGGNSLYVQALSALDHGARQLALMEKLGTNPAASLNRLIRKIQEEYRAHPDLDAFNKQIAGLQNVMGHLDGTLQRPANEWAAQLTDKLLTYEAAIHLGGVGLTHFVAAPFSLSAELAHHGISHFSAIGNALKAVVTGQGPKEVQDILADAGAYTHGILLGAHSRWQSDGGVPGFASWAMGNFMRMTGLPRFIDAFQAKGVKAMLMGKLGRLADGSYENIDEPMRALLGKYGIGKDEWDLMRQVEPTVGDGRRYVTPSDINKADAGKIEQLLRSRGVIDAGLEPTPREMVDRAVQKYRWDVADRYLMYLNDAAEHATVTPGVRERAMIFGQNRPGSLGWMIGRMLTQFKMWPIAAWNQVMNREIGYSLSMKQTASNIGWILALSTAGGALRMIVNDYAAGHPQRDYTNPVTLGAALAQGGGLGIFGDFLFGETSRMGAGLVPTAMGPIAADADRLITMANRFRNDVKDGNGKALDHTWPDLAHFMVGHVPFANLVYFKGALDYMLWYHLYEAASPGWWDRTNRRLIKEQGRPMAGYQPGAPIPYTPWAIGAR